MDDLDADDLKAVIRAYVTEARLSWRYMLQVKSRWPKRFERIKDIREDSARWMSRARDARARLRRLERA